MISRVVPSKGCLCMRNTRDHHRRVSGSEVRTPADSLCTGICLCSKRLVLSLCSFKRPTKERVLVKKRVQNGGRNGVFSDGPMGATAPDGFGRKNPVQSWGARTTSSRFRLPAKWGELLGGE